MDLKGKIRDVPDFPVEGVLFRDITPLIGDPLAFRFTIDELCVHAARRDASTIVGIESRGFVFGAAIADRMRLPFVPLRKEGKLPTARISIEYSLEYGDSLLEIHEDALALGKRAYIVDDLLATGGTAAASAKLVELAGGEVVGLGFVIELEDLRGRGKIDGYEAISLVRY
ncbi:MAG: adenine phosphoribosyltransferase [Dehalococcoidia bacterium]|nr:adenine phosphoribosyltransferase [Dehalococcoidia bacterium]